MTTIKEQVAKATARVGDDPRSLQCFYVPMTADERAYDREVASRPVVACTFDELPEAEFYAGFGGVSGAPVLCFSERYVYVKVVYDGSEWIEAVPRHPEYVKNPLPELGG